MNYSIHCPKCMATDGLHVPLSDLKCPQCSTEFVFLHGGLEVKDNSKYEFSTCPKCKGRYVYHSFMVPDGHDDVDWDSEEWCENPECPLALTPRRVDTMTEFGEVVPEENKKESTIL